MTNFLDIAKVAFGENNFTRTELKDLCAKNKVVLPRWLLNDEKYRVSRGVYNLGDLISDKKITMNTTNDNMEVAMVMNHVEGDLIPKKDPLYVRYGHYPLISKIIESRLFYPLYIAGLSGNGKTVMVDQACAENKRELYRVNITIETDEDDLLGGFRLVQDSTKWYDGPVIRAMRSGSILLLDEVNLASTKIMCLQPVLEGKGIFLKKINQFVKPEPGFNIIATANTKGQGDDTGKFVGTNLLNEAFLERFPGTVEQDYPNPATEIKILTKILDSAGITDQENFVKVLVNWAETNRKSYKNDAATEVITTRRLVHIINAFLIFQDKKKALELCLARFDQVTKETFIQLFESLDESMNRPPQPEVPQAEELKATDFDVESILGTK